MRSSPGRTLALGAALGAAGGWTLAALPARAVVGLACGALLAAWALAWGWPK